MKFHRLLAGTAVAALMATNASALSVSLAGASSGAPGAAPGPLAAIDLIESPIFLAVESDQTVLANAGTFAVTVTTNNAIASANNYLITLDILNGNFATQVTGDDLQNGTTVFNGTTIQFDGADRTGEVGDTSVRFLSSATTGNTDFSIVFDATATCTAPLNFRVTLQTEVGTSIEEGVAQLSSLAPAATCVDAYTAAVASDFGPAANDSVLVAPSFQTLTAAGSPFGADSTTEANVGTLSIAFDATNTGAPRTIYPTLAAAEDLATGALTGTFADIGVVSMTVAVDNTTGIDGIAVRAAGGAPTALTAGSATITHDPAALGASVAGIEVDLDGTVTLLETQPTFTSGTMTFVGAAAALATDTVVGAGGNLDKLQYAGARCGTFDWVGDSSLTRSNVFRVTNFANSVTDGIFATMTNSSAGVASTTLPIAAGVTVSNAEMSFTNDLLTSTFGNFGRADFSFNFIGATSTLDCDRLQSSPVSSVVTAFGNDTGAFGDGDD